VYIGCKLCDGDRKLSKHVAVCITQTVVIYTVVVLIVCRLVIVNNNTRYTV